MNWLFRKALFFKANAPWISTLVRVDTVNYFLKASRMSVSNEKPPTNLGFLLTLGGSLAVWMVGGVLLGRWVDQHWGITPWGIVAGTLLGFAGAGYSVFREVQRMDGK